MAAHAARSLSHIQVPEHLAELSEAIHSFHPGNLDEAERVRQALALALGACTESGGSPWEKAWQAGTPKDAACGSWCAGSCAVISSVNKGKVNMLFCGHAHADPTGSEALLSCMLETFSTAGDDGKVRTWWRCTLFMASPCRCASDNTCKS